MDVQLSWDEVALAIREGGARRMRHLKASLTDRYGWDSSRDSWGNDIEGAAAEIAVAKVTGIYWAPSGGAQIPGQGDVGDFEIRWTNRAAGRLIVYPGDADDTPYVLVTGCIPSFRVVGWILARDAKKDEYEAQGRLRVPGFMVPQSALTPLTGAVAA